LRFEKMTYDAATGTVFGSRLYTPADENTTTTVSLNSAAVMFLNGKIGTTAILGGAVTPIPSAQAVPVPTLTMLGLVLGTRTLPVSSRGVRVNAGWVERSYAHLGVPASIAIASIQSPVQVTQASPSGAGTIFFS
jgi:hypothetical protein